MDDVIITDGNGTIINNPAKRESSDDVTTVLPETTTAEAKKERKRREAEVKNENGDDKGSVEPVSSRRRNVKTDERRLK